MSILDDLTKKVTTTAKAVSKKSGDIFEITKLNLSISTEEEKILKTYSEIGENVYLSYKKEGRIDENINEIIEKIGIITSSEETISQIKKKVLELKNLKSCASCGREIEYGVLYCPGCGAKQEVQEEKTCEKVCSSCGTANGKNYIYCIKCGTSLAEKKEDTENEKVGLEVNEVICPACSTLNVKEALYCYKCGGNLSVTENMKVEETNPESNE